MGLVISSHTGAPNGWSSVNDGDVKITVENPEDTSYKLNSITINLAKGVGTVMDYYGNLRTGSSSATVQAYFCSGNSASGTRITNLVTVTNTASVRKQSSGSASDPSGYFYPSSTSYTFTFTNPPTITSGSSQTFTLCNSMTSGGILSWANKSSTPPTISSSPAVIPGSPDITDPVISIDSPVLVGHQAVPMVVTSSTSTTSPTATMTYWWYTKTYDGNGTAGEWTYAGNSLSTSGVTPAVPQGVTVTISSTVSKVDVRVYTSITDSRYETPTVQSGESVITCKGKCNPPTITIQPTGPRSAGETVSCIASTSDGSSFTVKYCAYISPEDSTTGDQPQQYSDWSSSSQVVVVNRPNSNYDGIYYNTKTTRSAYEDSEVTRSNKVLIYFSPRDISTNWTSGPNWGFSQDHVFSASTDTVTITPPILDITKHVGNYNYTKLVLINASTNSIISGFNIEGSRELVTNISLENYSSIFATQIGNTLKFRLYTYYAYQGEIIDDVPSNKKGLDSTYVESPTFTVTVGTVTILSQFPDLSMNVEDRVTCNKNLYVSFRVSSSDPTNNPVHQVTFRDDLSNTYIISNVDTMVAADYDSDLINGSGRAFAAWVHSSGNTRSLRMGFSSNDFIFILPQSSQTRSLRTISIQATLLDGTTSTSLENIQFYYEPYEDYPRPGSEITASDLVKLSRNFTKTYNAHRLHANISRILNTSYDINTYRGEICSVETTDLKLFATATYECFFEFNSGGEYSSRAFGPITNIPELYPYVINNRLVIRWFQVSSGDAANELMALVNDTFESETALIFSSLVTFIRKYL